MDRNDKVFTLLHKIVMHKKLSHPDEIQNIHMISLVCVRCVRMRSQGHFFLGFIFWDFICLKSLYSPGFFTNSSLSGPM